MFFAGREHLLPAPLSFLDDPRLRVATTVLLWVGALALAHFGLVWALRAAAQRIRGEFDDLILGALRRPAVILLGLYALSDVLVGASAGTDLVQRRLPLAAAYIVVALTVSKIVRLVVARYSQSVVRRTEKRLDDIVVHIAGLVGPLFIFAAAALLVLSLFGFSLTELLIGGGLIALVLGFALQDSLSNFFSGVGLLIDGPFTADDLVLLPGGRICRVNRVGARSTELYLTAEHATIYVSNRELSNMQIVNLTRPSQDLVVSVPFRVALHADLGAVREIALDIATCHPHAVLYSDEEAARRTKALEEQLRSGGMDALLQRKIRIFLERDVCYRELTARVDALRNHVSFTAEDMLKGIRDGRGVAQARNGQLLVRMTVLAARVAAVELPGDPWGRESERSAESTKRADLNAELDATVRRILAEYNSDDDAKQVKVPFDLQALASWLSSVYHKFPDTWHVATVGFDGYGPNWVNLHLSFCVYNITYENFGRRDRVVTEIAMKLHEALDARGWVGASARPPGHEDVEPVDAAGPRSGDPAAVTIRRMGG